MSLRKGTLQEYYNSPEGNTSAGCKNGDKGCYEFTVRPRVVSKLNLYIDEAPN